MTDYEKLQARIIALEILVRRVVAIVLADKLRTVDEFASVRKTFMASLQNVVRDFGESEDEIWAEALIALEQHLDEIGESVRRALR